MLLGHVCLAMFVLVDYDPWTLTLFSLNLKDFSPMKLNFNHLFDSFHIIIPSLTRHYNPIEMS